MAALLESPPRELSFADLSTFSSQLADDVGKLTPRNEGYTVEDYFKLDGNYLVEFVDGRLQILPMPTELHQALTGFLWQLLLVLAQSDPGARAQFSPIRVRVFGQKYREPDVCFMFGKHAGRRHGKYWDGADLVIEIVSDTNRNHDWVTKLAEYAAAEIPEYWIVDPDDESVAVFSKSDGTTYVDQSRFTRGQIAASKTLDGFSFEVSTLFDTAWARA
jgi:Uma2 family endonuclease